MAEKLLTDRQCKAARPRDSIYYRNDGNGLRLQVRPDGAKYWMLRYAIQGKESTAGLGRFPEVSLEQARQKAAQARVLVAQGIRPAVERQIRIARNVERSEATFQAVAEEWLAHNKPHWSGHHFERNEGLLRRILYPSLARLPIEDITEPLLLGILRKPYDSGIQESARRARGVAAQVFAYAKDTHRAKHNPARELAGNVALRKPEVKHFAALSAEQVGPLFRALESDVLEPTTDAALRLALYTGLRDHSLRAARWQEINFDTAIWTIPAERMKSGREHRVPLPKQALKILTKLSQITRTADDSYIFSSQSGAGYLAENTLRLALHRLAFKVTVHGFRSLITNVLNESGFNADAIERQLDHQSKDKVRAAYLRSDWLDYRTAMMQWFADWIASQHLEKTGPTLPANVIAFNRLARAA